MAMLVAHAASYPRTKTSATARETPAFASMGEVLEGPRREATGRRHETNDTRPWHVSPSAPGGHGGGPSRSTSPRDREGLAESERFVHKHMHRGPPVPGDHHDRGIEAAAE